MVYETGPYRLDAGERRLNRGGAPVHLQPKSLDLLILLVANSGRLVPRGEIVARLAYSNDTTLRAAVSQLRAALGEEGGPNVETVAKSGYCNRGGQAEHAGNPRPVA